MTATASLFASPFIVRSPMTATAAPVTFSPAWMRLSFITVTRSPSEFRVE